MMRLLLAALLALALVLAQDAAVQAETNTTFIPEDAFTPEAGVVEMPPPTAERAVESEPWTAAPMAVEPETTELAPVVDDAVQAEAVEPATDSADASAAPHSTEPAEPAPVATATPSTTDENVRSFQEMTASHSSSSSSSFSSSSSDSSVDTQSSGSTGVTPTKAAVLLVLGTMGVLVVLALLFMLRRRRRREVEAVQLAALPPTDASAPDLLASDADVNGLSVHSVHKVATWKTSGSSFASRDLPLGAATHHQREYSGRSSVELMLSLQPSHSPESPTASATARGFPGDARATDASSDTAFSVRSDSYSGAQGSTSSSIRSLDTTRSDSSAWSQRQHSRVSSFVPRDVVRTPSEREGRAMARTSASASATAGARDWYSVIESPADVHRASATSLDNDKRSDGSSFEL